MNIYILLITKNLLTLLLQSYTYLNLPSHYKNSHYIILSYLVLNVLTLSYIKYKTDQFKSKFLRRHYKPSIGFLLSCYFIEMCLILFFYLYVFGLVFSISGGCIGSGGCSLNVKDGASNGSVGSNGSGGTSDCTDTSNTSNTNNTNTSNYITMSINLLIIFIINLITIINKKTRQTAILEKNEEFFKICFLKEPFIVDDKVEIEQFDVVQVIGKKGDMVRVRRSDGVKFLCPRSIINDDVEVQV